MRIHKLWPSWLVVASLVVLFAGERVFWGETTSRISFAVAGALMLLVALVVRILEWTASERGASPAGVTGRRPVLGILVACTLGITVSVALYALIPLVFDGIDPASERVRGVLWAVWPLVLAASGLPLLFVEAAVNPVAYIDRYEHAHVRRNATRGLALALFLGVLFVGNYLAMRHDKKAEFGASSRAVASQQTRRIVRELTEKVRVVLFFPRADDVGTRVQQYFRPLENLNENLTVERVDHALASELAKKAGVTDNGYVALFRGEADDKIRVGTRYRSARSALRQLDNNFVRSLIRVTVSKKTAYFYKGHDERPFDSPRREDTRPALRKLRKQLENWQYTVKPFSVSQGSTSALPEDADLLFIVGPEQPFLDAEIEVLKDALKRGVRLFIALEAERSGDALDGLLAALGLEFDKTPLAASVSNVPLTKTRADQSYIYSNQFSTHASVTTMTRNTGKVAAIFYKAGSLRKRDEKLDGVKTDIVLTARRDTFADDNDNLTFDEGEEKRPFGLAAAVTVTSTTGKKKDEGRVFVLADADAMGDELFNLLPGNIYFLLDIVSWLQRKPEVFVPTSSDNDVKIVHKGTEDSLVFYGTTLAVPALILAIGAAVTRRRKRS